MFFADKNATSVLKPSDLIDGRTLTKFLLEKHLKASPLFEETFNLSEFSSEVEKKPGIFLVVQDLLDQRPTTGLMR